MNVGVQLKQWMERVDSLELRERILLLGATIVVLFLLIDSLGLQPILKRQQTTEQGISDMEMKLGVLHQQAELLNLQSANESLESRRQKKDELIAELSELDATILGQLGALVEPAQAAKVLEQVLTGQPGLRLESMRASAEPLESLDLEKTGGTSLLGRYQLELVLEGSFPSILSYLEALEAMAWKFFWQKIDFQVQQYPRATTRLQLYTLGARDG